MEADVKGRRFRHGRTLGRSRRCPTIYRDDTFSCTKGMRYFARSVPISARDTLSFRHTVTSTILFESQNESTGYVSPSRGSVQTYQNAICSHGQNRILPPLPTELLLTPFSKRMTIELANRPTNRGSR